MDVAKVPLPDLRLTCDNEPKATVCPSRGQRTRAGLGTPKRKRMAAKAARRIATMFFGAAVAALASSDLCAQTTKGPAHVAVLNPFSPPEPGFEAFRGALRELGYVEGQNLMFEVRWLLKSAGEPTNTVPPSSASLALTWDRRGLR
jgi:hypothetical protein